EDGEVARVIALVHGDLPDEIGHLVLHHARRAARRLDHAHAEPPGDRLEAQHRGVSVEAQPAAEKVVRIQVAERHGGVGDGRLGAAAPVADGAGHSTGRERPDAQAAARLVDPDDAAAAAADRADVDARHEVLVLVDHALVARYRAAVVDEPHSNDVPPISVAITCLQPRTPPRYCEASTPATGPESRVRKARRAASAAGTTPPPHCITCTGVRRPAPATRRPTRSM